MEDFKAIKKARYDQWKMNNEAAFRISSRNASKKWRLANPEKETVKLLRYRAKHKEAYNAYMNVYMHKKYEYKRECQRLRNIAL